MFYTDILLKKGGALHQVWLAATYKNRLRAANVAKIPIIIIGSQIMEILNSESTNPDKKFALRLSTRLVHGITVLYDKQVDMFVIECANFYKNLAISRMDKKKKKATKDLEQPAPREIEGPQEEFPFILRDINDITLRDAPIVPEQIVYDNFGAEGAVTINEVLESGLPLIPEEIQPENPLEPIVSIIEPIPDIPPVVPEINIIPDLPVVEPQVPRTSKRRYRDESLPEMELELEEYVPVEKPSKKRKCLVKIDREIILNSDFMKSMMRNDVYLRCETSKDDIWMICNLKTPEEMFKEPSRFRISSRLMFNFKRNLYPLQHMTELQDVSNQLEVMIGERQNTVIDGTFLTVDGNRSQASPSRTILHETGVMMPEESADMIKETSASAVLMDPSISMVNPEITVDMSEMNNEAQREVTQNNRGSEETMLGSEDRTKVSLGGENSSVVERRNQMDAEWGTQGLMMKIIDAKAAGLKPITIDTIMERVREPGVPQNQRKIAAKSFASLLRLATAQMVTIEKKPNSLEIAGIKIGKRLRRK